MDLPYTIFANFFCIQKSFHPHVLSWNHIFAKKKKIPDHFVNSLSIQNFWGKLPACIKTISDWSIDTQNPVICEWNWRSSVVHSGHFRVSTVALMHHILALFACLCGITWNAWEIWSEWSRGGKRKFNVAAVEFARWWNGVSCCLCSEMALSLEMVQCKKSCLCSDFYPFSAKKNPWCISAIIKVLSFCLWTIFVTRVKE